MAKKNSLTRQGVRDLSFLKGKSVGRRIDVPLSITCDHKNCSPQGRGKVCDDCGIVWDATGAQVFHR